MALEFDERLHRYTLDGVVLASVTQIINAVLPYDFGPGVGEWHMMRGQATHRACELLDAGNLDWSSVDPEILPRVRAWEKFRRDWPAEIIANESRLASAHYRFAGALDRLFRSDGKLVLVDLKNSVAPTVRLQLAFYSLLWHENHGQKVLAAFAVELNDNGTYRICERMDKYELRRAEQQALALLTVYSFAATHNLLRKS